MDSRIYHNGRFLRRGYTTGTCAAAASKAAAELLLTGDTNATVTITLPDGTEVELAVEEREQDPKSAVCAVRKDGGDDPDATHGLLIRSEVRKSGAGIEIDGGEGVGRVTKQGLDQPVGGAAINSGPRAMIKREVMAVMRETGYKGGLTIKITIPGGEEVARRTFNPKLGIVGGLSVLGTTGIVEPMSSKALADTVKLELRVLAAGGIDHVLLTPGNYGTAFIKEVLRFKTEPMVKCSNYLGDAIEAAAEYGFTKILLAGHIGKLVKLGIGAMNTHSAMGDGRIETLLACALKAGVELSDLHRILECVTTDAVLEILRRTGKMEETMAELGIRIEDVLKRKVPEGVEIGYICFSGKEIMIKSGNAEELSKEWYIS